MSEIRNIRDRLFELRTRINAKSALTPVESQQTVRTLVDELHQLAGAVNAEMSILTKAVGDLQQLVLPVPDPEHSSVPDFNQFVAKRTQGK